MQIKHKKIKLPLFSGFFLFAIRAAGGFSFSFVFRILFRYAGEFLDTTREAVFRACADGGGDGYGVSADYRAAREAGCLLDGIRFVRRTVLARQGSDPSRPSIFKYRAPDCRAGFRRESGDIF